MNGTRRKKLKAEFLRRMGTGRMPHEVERKFMKDHKKEWGKFKKDWKEGNVKEVE